MTPRALPYTTALHFGNDRKLALDYFANYLDAHTKSVIFAGLTCVGLYTIYYKTI